MNEADLSAELMDRVARGDRGALSELYDRHAPQLLGLGFKILGDRREAEDLLHDVFLEAWRNARDFDVTRGTVSAWLALRLRSRALDRLRSAGRRRIVSWDEVTSDDVRVESQVDERLDDQRLRSLLDSLPESQREVLILGYFSGLSSSEISSTLGIPIGTVKSRVAGALSKLRKALEDRGKS